MENVHPLLAYRRKHGLKVSDLAEMLGVTRVTVSRWERGHRKVNLTALPAVCALTGLNPSDVRPDIAFAMTPQGDAQ